MQNNNYAHAFWFFGFELSKKDLNVHWRALLGNNSSASMNIKIIAITGYFMTNLRGPELSEAVAVLRRVEEQDVANIWAPSVGKRTFSATYLQCTQWLSSHPTKKRKGSENTVLHDVELVSASKPSSAFSGLPEPRCWFSQQFPPTPLPVEIMSGFIGSCFSFFHPLFDALARYFRPFSLFITIFFRTPVSVVLQYVLSTVTIITHHTWVSCTLIIL